VVISLKQQYWENRNTKLSMELRRWGLLLCQGYY